MGLLLNIFSSAGEWLYTTLNILYVFTTVSIIIVIIMENRNPVKSLAWVVVLVCFPFVGIIFYLFFGQNYRKKRMISRKGRQELKKTDEMITTDIHSLPISDTAKQTVYCAQTLDNAPYYSGNQVRIFTNGKEKFDVLLQDLKAAQSYVHLQYYIIENDNIGRRIKRALLDCAHRGVQVRILYDDVGCRSIKKQFFKDMEAAGIEIHPFLKVSFSRVTSRINYRNHRKICVIDGEIGYIGGMNIADRYIDGVSWGIWRDTHLRVAGPAAHGLEYSFAVDWSFERKELLSDTYYFPRTDTPGTTGMQIVTSGPIGKWYNLSMLFLKAISSAKRYVYLQTPYFLPTDSLMKVIQAAALSRVDIRIMLPERSDSKILMLASNSYVAQLLSAGAKVYFYKPGMLHSKAIVIDDEIATVGSTNFDFRSFEHNFEANALIYDPAVAIEMKEIFLNDQSKCRRVTSHEWRKRSRHRKIQESLMRLLSPVL